MTQREITLSIEEAADYTGIGRNTFRPISYTHLHFDYLHLQVSIFSILKTGI